MNITALIVIASAAVLGGLLTAIVRIMQARQPKPYHVIVQVSSGEVHADLATYDQVLDLIASADIDRERLR